MTRACSTKTRDNGFKIKKGTFRMDLFFTGRVVRHWHRFLRDVDAHYWEFSSLSSMML